ncbi:MAG TPA: FAD-dependent oxidoreductase [Burkholderiales bacterium]|nr:FAD-dependent oxidoreductase [Burkholderiales bacterium]
MPSQFKSATALSIPAGTSTANQDLHWLAKNIPCQSACPAGTDIPGYLEAIYHGRFAEAYEINLRDNVFPAVLGRVCSRPCEDACRHGWEGNGEPVAICFSKRSAADFSSSAPVVLEPRFPVTGKRVAVVGAGVAGLTAARELARSGHGVIVFEKHRTPGGMLNQGIPAFRLPREIIDREIHQIAATGVTIRCGVAVGTDVKLAQLSEDFDAVVLAAGTLRPNVLDLPGRDLQGIEHGLSFLLQVNEFGRRDIGGRVVVIGGGYTAMDCARTALRLGAQVGVVYRRAREDMMVLPGELEELLEEGGHLETNCAPLSFLGHQGKVIGARFVRTRQGKPGSDGRRAPVEIPGTEFEIGADAVILATGQFPQSRWIDAALAPKLVARDGWLASGTAHQTAQRNIFVAGDFALGATTLIQAIGHAKECARAVDEWLTDAPRMKQFVHIGAAFRSKVPGGRTTGRTAEMNVIPIHPMPRVAVPERGLEAEVETGFAIPVAKEEASRCYLCHYKFEIVDRDCVLCDECLKVKPVEGCIVEIASLRRDDEGRILGYKKVEKGETDSLYYNRLWIDQSQCIRCGRCETVCPVNAITIQKVALAAPATQRPRE